MRSVLDPPARGDVIAGRFVVEAVAGRGGMGIVARAHDRYDGAAVALKLLQAEGAGEKERFAREGRLLASLQHPAIVRWIAHGVAANGQRYLAMEWLDGESLATYLARTRPGIRESIALVRMIAEGLSIAHARGVVHRDLKPSNIFLAFGDLSRPKVLDFGVAMQRGDEELLTVTGAAIGTPGYMSPEQARGERAVDARSDVFSLGALLYRCLVGKRPFEGRDSLALLMRVILEDAPRLRDELPDAPAALDELLSRMLSRNRELRPADARAVVELLDALGAPASEPAPKQAAPPAITASEQRVLAVVVVGERGFMADAPKSNDRMERIARSFGGTIHPLVGGALVVVFTGSGVVAELAVRAARCALAIREEGDAPPIAVVIGRGELSDRLRTGDLTDRGSELLGLAREGVIRIDESTLRLIETRFDCAPDAHGHTLVGERDTAAIRTLLGRFTPLVGRDRELLHLESYLEECIAESVARAVLVTGPHGIGKSRLRYELLRRVERREEPIEVWLSHGDPMRAGAPYTMIAPALRRAAGILDGEPLEVRREKLRARVQRASRGSGWDEADTQRITEFLGELISVSFDEGGVQLRAARRDPVLLADQIRRAFEDFVGATVNERPLLIVLDDLQWGDSPSVRLLDATLRVLGDRPIMILALARPELHDMFPRLWSARGVQEIRLGQLTARASERLIRLTLGEVDGAVVTRILERAEGNAFFLEELIRAAATGTNDVLPSTLLAVAQARIDALEPEARRVLRAGAVFGHVFHRGGVRALLGEADEQVDEWLTTLVSRELLSERPASRLAGEREFVFRHALLRDAAYAMLVDDDRALGHRVALDWLESAGETEAMLLAEHAERGGFRHRAMKSYRRSAEQALEANDFAAAVERAERARERGAEGEERGSLLVLMAEAHRWSGQFELALARGEEALALLRPGTRRWFQAAGEVAQVSGRRGDRARLLEVSRALLAAISPSKSDAVRLVSVLRAVVQLFYEGCYEDAIAGLRRVEPIAASSVNDDPAVAARLEQARVARAMTEGDLDERRRSTALAADCFRLAGDLRNACTQTINLAYVDLVLGCNEVAAEALTAGISAAERMGLQNVAAVAKQNLGQALARLGRLDEALVVERAAVATMVEHGDRRMEGVSRANLAWIYLRAGDVAAAESEARAAVSVTEHSAPMHAHALASLGEVLLARGAGAEALTVASLAREVVDRLGGIDSGEGLVYLVHAEALDAVGEREAARSAIADARARIEAQAARIRDPSIRARFLSNVPENARIVTRSREWG